MKVKKNLVECCPICGGEVTERNVSEIVQGGNHTATLKIDVLVCLSCNERLYSLSDIQKMEQLKDKLERQETADLTAIGQSFAVN
jgi:YgiT-type zinc finger domain-containing protein